MPARERWFVFADDAGNPNISGSPTFGYALVGVDRDRFDEFVASRVQLRAALGSYGEAKRARLKSAGFQIAMAGLETLAHEGVVRCAAAFITKERYKGAWLRDEPGRPRPSHWLRNYLVRKSLELMFDGHGHEDATVEVVLDRVRYSLPQLKNFLDYLGGKFNEHGPFPIPEVTDITHADSKYVEGLQVAHHLSRLANRIVSRPDEAVANFGMAGRLLRIQTIIGGRDFQTHPDALEGQQARKSEG